MVENSAQDGPSCLSLIVVLRVVRLDAEATQAWFQSMFTPVNEMGFRCHNR